MSELPRNSLKSAFENGDRPSGQDFANLIDSFVNKADENVSFDSDGNMRLTRGVQLGDSAGTVAGGLRFNSNQLQVFTGGAWVDVSGSSGGGVFQQLPTGPAAAAVAYNGAVGIGNFPTGTPITFRLEVPLAANTGATEQVRFGNVVCCNGAGNNFRDFAVVAHQQQAAANVNANFALRQAPSGPVQINAPLNQPISLRQGGVAVRLGISAGGNVIVGGESDLAGIPNPPGTALLQVAGEAFKTQGASTWLIGSDARLKNDVRNLEVGLTELRQVRPVRFRYNGRAGTSAGEAGVGVLGQEIETVFPETIRHASAPHDPGLADLRIFDSSMLTYVLINAVKELADRVERLEQALAVATAATTPAPTIA